MNTSQMESHILSQKQKEKKMIQFTNWSLCTPTYGFNLTQNKIKHLRSAVMVRRQSIVPFAIIILSSIIFK